MICSGRCRLRFIENHLAHPGSQDPRKDWISLGEQVTPIRVAVAIIEIPLPSDIRSTNLPNQYEFSPALLVYEFAQICPFVGL